jgi:hypothetical protein
LIGGFLPGFFAAMSCVSLDDAEPNGYALLTAAALLSPGIPVLLATRESAAAEMEQGTSAAGLLGAFHMA